jgi:integrase
MTSYRNHTLADVLAAVSVSNLPGTAIRDMSSALRKVGEVTGRDLAEIPADPARLNVRLQEISPSAHGISKQRWANCRSLTLKAIGLLQPIMPGRRLNKMLPEWEKLQSKILKQSARIRIGPLFRWLSEANIGPEAVTEADLLEYKQRLLSGSLRGEPEKAWDALLWDWNAAVREVDGFPQITLQRQGKKQRKTVGWQEFPPSLHAEVDDWMFRLGGDDLFGDGPVQPVTEATRKTRDYQLLYFASGLARSGIEPSRLKTLADLVMLENFEKGMRFLFDEKKRKKSSHLSGIGGALIAVARHKVLPESGMPEIEISRTLDRMRHIIRVVSPEGEGLTEKNLERILQFESEEAIGRFLNLPDELRDRIDQGNIPFNQKHAMADVALALEILFVAPVRMKNLSGIELEKNLIRQRDGYVLVFAKEEVKNRERLTFKLPPQTCKFIDWYKTNIRSERIRGETNALFIGEDGIRLKAQNTLASQIAKKVKDYTGLKFNAHLIRHVTSFLFLNKVPGGHHVLRLVLGHKSVDTLSRAYSGAESKAAHKFYDGVIRGLRTKHAPSKKRKGSASSDVEELPGYSDMPLPDQGRLRKRGR